MYNFFLLGLGPMTYVAFPLINIHFLSFYVSTGVFHSILHELYQFLGCMAYLGRPSWLAVELISSNWATEASWATLLGLNGLLGCMA